MDKIEALEQKIDHLTECMYSLMNYIEERDKHDFDTQVLANVTGDMLFESLFYPDSFFEGKVR